MNISFALTTKQFRDRTKTVTRRLGWNLLKVGSILTACEKCQGLKRGEHPVILGKIRVTDKRREPLDEMSNDLDYGLMEVVLEGFPALAPSEFVEMFCKHNGCRPFDIITRIGFEYLDNPTQPSERE